MAIVRWVGFKGQRCVARGWVRNVSAGGLAVLLHEPLAVGQRVQIRLNEVDHPACIRRCQSVEQGFEVGVEMVLDDMPDRWQWLYCRDFTVPQYQDETDLDGLPSGTRGQ
jgi:hypothetical protein